MGITVMNTVSMDNGHGYRDSGSNYRYGYAKGSWKKGVRNRPAFYRVSWGQNSQEPLYLDSRSASKDVAQVLREAASLVGGKPLRRGEDFSFLGRSDGKSEVLRALQECYWFLKVQGEKGTYHEH